MMSIITNPLWGLIGRIQFALAITVLILLGMIFYFNKKYKQSLPTSTIFFGIVLSVVLAYSGFQSIQGANIARHASLVALLLGLIFELSYRRKIYSDSTSIFASLISYAFIIVLFISAFSSEIFLNRAQSFKVLLLPLPIISILIIFNFLTRKKSISLWILIFVNSAIGMTLWNLWSELSKVNG